MKSNLRARPGPGHNQRGWCFPALRRARGARASFALPAKLGADEPRWSAGLCPSKAGKRHPGTRPCEGTASGCPAPSGVSQPEDEVCWRRGCEKASRRGEPTEGEIPPKISVLLPQERARSRVLLQSGAVKSLNVAPPPLCPLRAWG